MLTSLVCSKVVRTMTDACEALTRWATRGKDAGVGEGDLDEVAWVKPHRAADDEDQAGGEDDGGCICGEDNRFLVDHSSMHARADSKHIHSEDDGLYTE